MGFTENELTEYRSLFPVTRHLIYLNHASTSPLSTRAEEAIRQYLRERSELLGDNWHRIREEAERLRELIGRLINTDSRRIAFVPNTNTGLNIVAAGLDWKAGDEILISEGEFPANVYPWLNLERRGVRIRFLPAPAGGLEPERLRRAITTKTRLLALSSVEFLSGYAHDLRRLGEICKERDIWFVVDGIQGTGVIPIDVTAFQIDALANGGHKWLMWLQGFGFLFVSEKLQEQLQPAYGGWVGVRHPDEFLHYPQELSETARRYETGGYSSAAIPAAVEMLKLFFKIGIVNIYEHLKKITSIFTDGLKMLDYRLFTNEDLNVRSGIVTFFPEDRSQTQPLFDYLTANGVVLSQRESMLRIAPHFYNTAEEMNRVLELIDQFNNKVR